MLPLATLVAAAGVAAAPPPTLRALYGLAPPERLDATRTALLLVDVQEEFAGGGLPLDGIGPAAGRARRLLDWARDHGVLVVHVRQIARSPSSLLFAPGSRGVAPLAGFEPKGGEWIIEKAAGGAFTSPELEPRLRGRGVERIVVAGFMTHLAVAATATDATMRGFGVIVAADATATRALPAGDAPLPAALVQRAALAAIADRAADVLSVEQILGLRVDR